MKHFRGNSDRFSVQCYKEATKEYENLLKQEEIFWKQRAKKYWLQSRNCNSIFFHAYASARKKKNQSFKIKGENAHWRNWTDGLGNLIESFYSHLFATQDVDMDEVLNCIDKSISFEKNRALLEEFTWRK